jgi:MFS superfamily sulfate permease-like transporter
MGLKFRHLLHPFFVTKESDINADIDIESSLTFSNFMDVKSVIMDELLANKNVTLNLSRCDYVDHNVMEELEELKKVFHEKQLSLSLKLSPKHISLGKEQSSSLKKQLE